MTRFIGVKNNRIYVVSDKQFSNNNYEVIEVPEHLNHISSAELITSCRVNNGVIKSKIIFKEQTNLKIAFVGNWKMKCGISTYSENLWPEIGKHIGDFKLFIEKNDFPTGPVTQFGETNIDSNKVVTCWQRGEPVQDLINEIKKYDPDVILISHEFGLWSNSRYWLSLMTQLSEYRVIVTIHSTFPDHHDKVVYEAAIPEMIVHLEASKHNLKNDKNVNAIIHVIPHGCYKITNQDKLWNNYKSNHTFIQQGFGFHYKNFETSIKAVGLLKNKYPDIFFTALFSESNYCKSEHQIYYNELINLINELNVQENVAIIRGFQQQNVVDSYLRSNQAAVFPYLSVPGHEVYGASGAARLAMAAGIPVITSTIPHFSDVPSIKADSPEELANQLDKLFCNDTVAKDQIQKQNKFINDNSWEEIANQYIDVIKNS